MGVESPLTLIGMLCVHWETSDIHVKIRTPFVHMRSYSRVEPILSKLCIAPGILVYCFITCGALQMTEVNTIEC